MSDDKPNVLFLLSDQHNYRCVSHRKEDGHPVRTPAIDSLATNGVYYSEAYTPSPLCVPARYCLLTGRHAPRASAWGHSYVLPPALETIPETFSDDGYETCLVGKMHLGGNRQYAGFDHRPYGDLTGKAGHQHEPPGPNNVNLTSYVNDVGVSEIPESMTQERRVNEESIAFLREHRASDPDRPWFLCASFCRPHWPRRAPKRFIDRYDAETVPRPDAVDGDASDHPLTNYLRNRYGTAEMTFDESMEARASYFACVDFVDEVIKDLLTTLENDGLLENTIVVYTSDHGDMIGEYSSWDKHIWHDESTRVPLSIQLPEHRSNGLPAKQVSTPVSLIDLYPTLCGLTNVARPNGLDGHDLSESIRSGEEPDREPVYVDYLTPLSNDDMEYRMIRDGRYKYVKFRTLSDFFFDLENDPHERTNILDDAGGKRASIRDQLSAAIEESLDFEAAVSSRQKADNLIGEHKLGCPEGTGNAYHLDSGRIVDADTPLYHPHVLAEDPNEVYDDYPYEVDSGSFANGDGLDW
ncbi:sulfatase family protein [Natrarchaeobius oligotrophus]|uniref:DUF229 domain-containing protein n=1 Tax=Natrarchaeobius chitinivorans TaxID=1679083 RepID=A0A3N6MDE7_NATCH|nr:sulfatase-like hydrolase/transferase [Natrarchaeobius chitinivorans]RQH00778.1 DUF229 domain-containing protein [Natrarchaeobius chitinivorans]